MKQKFEKKILVLILSKDSESAWKCCTFWHMKFFALLKHPTYYKHTLILTTLQYLNQFKLNIFYLKQIWTSVGTLISLPAFLTLSSWESICYSSMLKKKLSISSSSSALFCTGWTAIFFKDIHITFYYNSLHMLINDIIQTSWRFFHINYVSFYFETIHFLYSMSNFHQNITFVTPLLWISEMLH